MSDENRPNPDDLLSVIANEELKSRSATLRIFLGMSAGVGKTYAMLKAAHQRKLEGLDIVIGIVETHGRAETASLLDGLEVIPRAQVAYKGTQLQELDVDAILARKPQIVIVDELAHTNVPGLRHAKRYQDVLEILDAGIDVYTALNVQHLESRKDSVEAITQISIRETVPDSILERASQVELVDIAPVELLKRLREGKVYLGDKAERAAQGFFKEDRLTALREIALRLTAERVDQDLQRFVTIQADRGPWQTNERLMVAVSFSPFSERLIRATRRLAYNLEAPWVAVYIDTGLPLTIEDQAQLSKNLNLARELKAEVITTTETDVPAALRRIARQKNVTQILVGRPTRRWFRDILEGGSLLDRLVRESAEIDVHVIRNESGPSNKASLLASLRRIQFQSGPVKYWNTFLFVSLVALIFGPLDPYIGYRTVGFGFLLAVMIVGMVSNLGPVVFSALLSVLVWNFFFIPPRLTFAITESQDFIMCIAFVVVALIMGFLTNRIRFHERLIRVREERTNVLYETLQDVASSHAKADFLLKTVKRVGSILNAECGVFLADTSGKLTFDFNHSYALAIDEKAQAVAAWAFQSQKPAGWSTDTLSEAQTLNIPLKGPSELVGVFVFRPKTRRRLDLEQETLLYSILRQLAISLERHFFEKRLLEAQRLRESEKLHQTLLNSISHEMRTPLTTIIGSASALADETTSKDPVFIKKVASQLTEAGDRLNRVIENLLDMSRLNSGVLELKLDWHDVHDLVGVNISKLTHNIGQHKVRTEIPDDLPVIKMDFRLMEHAIANLILNAALYSPQGSEIKLTASYRNKMMEIKVDDQGPGIPLEARARIFDKFYRIPGTPTGGTGLGLSIVKSIVEAHRGYVDVDASPLGGASFTVHLPVEEEAPGLPPEEIEA
jgi:two-component system sensor histidine kinase KdpD